MLWKLWKPDPNPKPFNPLEYRMKFKSRLSAFILFSIVVILMTLITLDAEGYKELVKSIVQYFLGGVIGSVITYYFDGNEGSLPVNEEKSDPDTPEPVQRE